MSKDLEKRSVFSPAWGFNRMNSLLNEMDDCFGNLENMFGMSRFGELNTGKFVPAVDLIDNEKEIEARFEVPGLTKEDISISLENGILTVSGEKKNEVKENKDDYYYAEISYGSFARTVKLPNNVDESNISALYKDGILTVTIPKLQIEEKEKTRKIEIKTE